MHRIMLAHKPKLSSVEHRLKIKTISTSSFKQPFIEQSGSKSAFSPSLLKTNTWNSRVLDKVQHIETSLSKMFKHLSEKMKRMETTFHQRLDELEQIFLVVDPAAQAPPDSPAPAEKSESSDHNDSVVEEHNEANPVPAVKDVTTSAHPEIHSSLIEMTLAASSKNKKRKSKFASLPTRKSQRH